MFDAIKPYALLIKVAAVLAALVALVVGWNALTNHYEQIGYDRAKGECRTEQARAVIAAKVAYDAELTKILDDRKKADHAADQRYQALAADHERLRSAHDGLRHTTRALRADLAAASADAVRATAAAALDVFDECSSEAERLAAAADGHAADVQTLTEAWPK